MMLLSTLLDDLRKSNKAVGFREGFDILTPLAFILLPSRTVTKKLLE